MTLEELGFGPAFAEAFRPYGASGLVPGRVTIPHRGICWVLTERGEVEATVAGRLRRSGAGAEGLPAAGDWVALTAPSGDGRARIEAVLPRASRFVRKAPGKGLEAQVVAANVDTAFVVTAVGRDLNLRRLERYLALAWESGAQPVVVVTKGDLDDDPAATERSVRAVALGAPVLLVSGKTGGNLDALRPYLAPGLTVALVGSSGVGKSTLVNALVGSERQKVAGVGAWGKGRHTTSQRELIPVPGGGLLVDTPGMRELQIWDAADGIEETFAEVDLLAAGCRFADCRHEREPDCAVLSAVETGTLDASRLESYRKLRAEQSEREVKRKQRIASKTIRAFQKLDPKR